MGYLFKILLLGLVLYFIFRKISAIIRVIMGRSTPQRGPKNRTKKEGDINIHYKPDNSNGQFGEDFKGGEYVDYEEVK